MIVYTSASLFVNGTIQEPVIIQGDRLHQDFQDVPGQWDRIWLYPGSKNSYIRNAIIKNGNVGGIFGIRGAEKVRQAQEMAVKNSRLGIPLIVGMDVIHGHQTVFPIPLGLSCSWDMKLIEQSARIAAREATADGIMWTFSPMVDIARDPRWGRISEGNGEDPFLGSKIASSNYDVGLCKAFCIIWRR